MSNGPLRLMGRGVDDDPLLELAVSHALLREASETDAAPVVRIYQPSAPMAVFGRRDVRAPGFAGAVESSRTAGFVPAARVTGGRAVAYTTRALSSTSCSARRTPCSTTSGSSSATGGSSSTPSGSSASMRAWEPSPASTARARTR